MNTNTKTFKVHTVMEDNCDGSYRTISVSSEVDAKRLEEIIENEDCAQPCNDAVGWMELTFDLDTGELLNPDMSTEDIAKRAKGEY